jgi:hypothetical protein
MSKRKKKTKNRTEPAAVALAPPRVGSRHVLGRASLEFFGSLLYAAVIMEVQMNDLMRCLLLVPLLPLAIDLCWRSERTINLPKGLKWLLTIIAVVTFGFAEYQIIGKPRTYIYFVPTHELIDAQRRAFFIKSQAQMFSTASR